MKQPSLHSDETNLITAWQMLDHQVTAHGHFDAERFKSVYTETYDILKNCACRRLLDRDFIPLFSAVYTFLRQPENIVSREHEAAFALTQNLMRLADYGVHETPPQTASARFLTPAGWTDILLDFSDVDTALAKIKEQLR